ILFHFRVHQNVRSAGSSAVAALIARRCHTDFPGRQLVGQPEKSAIGTGISAKAFLPKKIDGHETADEKKRNGHSYRGKRLPEISSHQMIGKLWDKRFLRLREQSIDD